MTLAVVCVIVLVVLVLLIILIIFTQKHRADKRKRLEGSLMHGNDNGVWRVCCGYGYGTKLTLFQNMRVL